MERVRSIVRSIALLPSCGYFGLMTLSDRSSVSLLFSLLPFASLGGGSDRGVPGGSVWWNNFISCGVPFASVEGASAEMSNSSESEATEMGSDYSSAVMNGTVAVRDVIIAVILFSAFCLIVVCVCVRVWTWTVGYCATSPQWTALVDWCEYFCLLWGSSPRILDDTPLGEDEGGGGGGGIFQWFAERLGGGKDVRDSHSAVSDGVAPARYTSQGWQKLNGVAYDEKFDCTQARGDVLISGTLLKKTTRKGIGRFLKGDTWIPRLCELHENGFMCIWNTRGVTKVQFMVQQTMVQILRKKMGKYYILEVIPKNILAGLQGEDTMKLGCSSLQQAEEWLQVITLVTKNPQAIP